MRTNLRAARHECYQCAVPSTMSERPDLPRCVRAHADERVTSMQDVWDRLSVSDQPGIAPVPHPPSAQDVAALVGIMALLEGESLAGSIDDRVMRRIGDRLERVGLLASHVETAEVRQALSAMNCRLRHALGEGDVPAE